MKIKMMGLTVCLLGMASAANAGYAWNQLQGTSSVSKSPAAATHGYAWNQ